MALDDRSAAHLPQYDVMEIDFAPQPDGSLSVVPKCICPPEVKNLKPWAGHVCACPHHWRLYG